MTEQFDKPVCYMVEWEESRPYGMTTANESLYDIEFAKRAWKPNERVTPLYEHYDDRVDALEEKLAELEAENDRLNIKLKSMIRNSAYHAI